MPITKISICNTALSRIGISSFITSIEEDSVEASVFRVVYDLSVERVLREFSWPFAQQYETLVLVADELTTPWKSDWAYRYRYPTNALAVRRIVTSLGRLEPSDAPYSIGRDASGKLIYTDIDSAVAEITGRVTNPAEFDHAFASALSWYIASEVSMPLSAMDALRKQAMQGYMMELDVAKRIATNEGRGTYDIDTELINSRFGPVPSGTNELTIFPSGFTVG